MYYGFYTVSTYVTFCVALVLELLLWDICVRDCVKSRVFYPQPHAISNLLSKFTQENRTTMASQYRYSGRQHAGYRPVNTSPDRHASPARGGATPGIQNPQEFGLNSRLETAMINVRKSMRPGGTKNTLDGKVEEYNQYWASVPNRSIQIQS
jgi:hypothetical protein